MSRIRYLWLLLFINLLPPSISTDDDAKLRNVFLLWRHGDRAPYGNHLYSNKSEETLWPDGLGELTNIGIDEQFNLGLYLKSLYSDFIPKIFNYKYLHVRSSDYDRTLMSALSNLAGFYSNASSPLSKYGINWRPVPVHTVKKKTSEALFSAEKCPYFDKLMEIDREKPATKKFMAEHEYVVESLEKNLGYKPSSRQLWSIGDEIVCIKSHGYDLPKWITPKFEKGMTEIDEYFWKLRYSSDEKLRLTVGVFLHKLISHMNALIKTGKAVIEIDGKPKELAPNHIMAYSAHDTNVAPLITAFGVGQPGMPGYTATVFMELYGPPFPGKKSEYKFRLMYKNSFKHAKATPIKLPYCSDEYCPFTDVENYIKKYALTEKQYTDMCARNVPDSTRRVWIIVLSSILIFGVLILLILLVYYCVKKSRENNRYERINPSSDRSF